MNQFDFVKTISSCQGHYCKIINPECVYYYTETSEGLTAYTIKSHIRTPYVVLMFINKKLAKDFTKQFERLQGHTGNWSLYILNEKKEKKMNIISCPSIILNQFDSYISITMYIGKLSHIRYHRERMKITKIIDNDRDVLFNYVERILKSLKNNLDV